MHSIFDSVVLMVGIACLVSVALVVVIFLFFVGLGVVQGTVSALRKRSPGVAGTPVHSDTAIGRALVETRERLATCEWILNQISDYGDLSGDHQDLILAYFDTKARAEELEATSAAFDSKHTHTAHGAHR